MTLFQKCSRSLFQGHKSNSRKTPHFEKNFLEFQVSVEIRTLSNFHNIKNYINFAPSCDLEDKVKGHHMIYHMKALVKYYLSIYSKGLHTYLVCGGEENKNT